MEEALGGGGRGAIEFKCYGRLDENAGWGSILVRPEIGDLGRSQLRPLVPNQLNAFLGDGFRRLLPMRTHFCLFLLKGGPIGRLERVFGLWDTYAY